MSKNIIEYWDPGHGVDTAGKCSPDRSLLEYKKARELVKDIVAKRRAMGYDARILVPEETDVPLSERCRRVNETCNKVGKDKVIVISVHCNAAGSDGKWKTAGGWCVYTSPGQTKADISHDIDAQNVSSRTSTASRFSKSREPMTRSRFLSAQTGVTEIPTMKLASISSCIRNALRS